MVKKKVIRSRWLSKVILLGMLFVCPVIGIGCSFNPLSYFAKNACDMLNCNVLFFLEDLFPLSTRPTGTGGASSGGEQQPEEEEEHAAH